jgi:lipopolysaccharide biosynthesis glycosyltransferase
MQCVCYVSDSAYAFPAFVSALQARALSRPETDIVVLMTEKLPDLDVLTPVFQAQGVIILDVTDLADEALFKVDRSHFSSRITLSALGKLVLDDLLPKHYDEVIYLDGDTQIVEPLEALEAFRVPAGKFLAARDYTSALDLIVNGRDTHYFNSGVLKFNRSTWIGHEAFNFFVQNPEACGGFHDQGALNAIAGDSAIFVSSLWNFPKQLLHLLNAERPAIVHYMANPKPWNGVYFPWGKKEAAVYDTALGAFPLLKGLHNDIGLERKLLYRYRSIRDSLVNRRAAKPDISRLFRGDYPI